MTEVGARMVDRRQVVLAGTMAGGALLAGFAHPGRGASPISQGELEAGIPQAVGRYRAVPATDVVLPPGDELTTRVYDRYMARAYAAPGHPTILVVIAFGATQDFRLALHRPEVCYPASGWQVGPTRVVTLPIPGGRSLPGVTLAAERPGRRERILYWSRIGGRFPVDQWDERREILRGVLSRTPRDGVVLRLSTPATGEGDVAVLADFNRRLLAATAGPSRSVLLGRAA